jgi:mRNA interferase MazF
MLRSGDVVTASVVGAVQTKRRPAVVVSTDLYHTTRPDVILGELTSQVVRAAGPTDYVLQDWAPAGLRQPSAFRAFLYTIGQADATWIGQLSDRDWQEVKARLRQALAVM